MAAYPPSSREERLKQCRRRPCYLLSVELLQTYKHINEKFYETKRKQVNPTKPIYNEGYDDDQGNYVVQTGEEIAGRYIVQDVLGKGSFGIVVKAHDHRREESVALKIIKNKVQFYHQAKVEIEILTKLNEACSDEHNIVKLKKVFPWKDHICLVFELLSFNLYDLLKYTRFSGVSLNLVRKFAVQILRTLSFLSAPETNIIHCDLKPENVLLRNPKRSSVKVIDFGSSCFVSKRMYKYIQSRFYRAPEVILGLPYGCPIDMWSLATMLVEMHTGQPLFDGKDEAEQLCKFQALLGPVATKMIEASPKRQSFYQWDNKSKKWILAPPGKDVSKYPRARLMDIVNTGRKANTAGHTENDYQVFVDFISGMLKCNPDERSTSQESLRHPFVASLVQQEHDVSELPNQQAGSYDPSQTPSGRVAGRGGYRSQSSSSANRAHSSNREAPGQLRRAPSKERGYPHSNAAPGAPSAKSRTLSSHDHTR